MPDLKPLTEEELQIARETVGYLLSKAKELRHLNENQNFMFKERAEVIQKLIDYKTRHDTGTNQELEVHELSIFLENNISTTEIKEMSNGEWSGMELSKKILSHFSKPNGKLSVSMSSDKIGLCSVEYGKPLEDEGQKREVVMPSKITLEEIIDEVSHNTIPENDVVLISQSILSHLQEINGVKNDS